MKKEPSRWEPERISGMTTGAIVGKLKELVPSFELDSFIAKTGKYLSCEDLTEAEYYPVAKFSDEDEDFIWMACEELWKRLVPDKPAVEHMGDLIDNNIEKISEADEKGKAQRIVQLSTETFELIYHHIIEESPTGYRLKHEFYEKLRESTLHDINDFIDAHLILLHLRGENERVMELGEILHQAFEDDAFLDYKAQSLFALNRRKEGEECYREIISRNPDNIWFPVHAGDCFLQYGEKEFEKAKDYYALALDAAKKSTNSPEGREDLYLVYEKVINLAREMGDTARADRLQGMLDSLRVISSEAKPPARGKVGRNDPWPRGMKGITFEKTFAFVH